MVVGRPNREGRIDDHDTGGGGGIGQPALALRQAELEIGIERRQPTRGKHPDILGV